MLSHVNVGSSDLSRSMMFYRPLMDELGLVLKFSGEEWAGWIQPGNDRPLFVVALPFDGRPASSGNGHMLALLARSRGSVDRCHAIAIRHGGTNEGDPGLRPHYHPDYYGAYFRDPDGNKLSVCCHQPDQ